MIRRRYAQRRNLRRKDFVRLRGRRWFRLIYFSMMIIIVTIIVLLIGNLAKQIQIGLEEIVTKLAQKNAHMDVTIDWNGIVHSGLMSFKPKPLVGELLNTPVWDKILMFAIWLFAMWSLIIKRWYNWITLYANRIKNANHFADYREIDSIYTLIPDRNKYYPGKPGQPVAHMGGLNWRILLLHPLLWTRQLLKAPLGLNKEIFPKWYQEIRPQLMKRFPKWYKRQFNVKGGFSGFYWIDTDATHSKTTGATRSGKDQMRGYPLIDIVRRSLQPWNIIDTDAKNEDFKMSYKALREAGFDVISLNIMDVDQSQTFNPFQLALDYAMDGDLDHAKIEVSKVVQIIGSDSNKGNSDVWDKTAEATQQSVILILLLLSIENNDPKLATPSGVPQFINSLNEYSDQDSDGLTKYLEMLRKREHTPLINEILLTAGSYLGSTGDTKTSVMFTLQSRSMLFASENVARLTASNSLNVMDMAYPRMLKIKFDANYSQRVAKIRLYDQSAQSEDDFLEEDKVRATRAGIVQYPFKEKFPENWAIVVSFDDKQNPHNIREDEINIIGHKEKKRILGGRIFKDEYTKQPIQNIVTDEINQKLFYGEGNVSLRYSEKPRAVFIITPQDNDNYAAIATLFISQVFSVTTSIASNITRRKLTNPILYKLNEFSMFPRIPGFNNLLTRGLTYGHIVDLYLQSIAQLSLKYSKEEVTEIDDNTLSWYHVLTPNKDTNKEVSDALGTIKVLEESVNSQVGLDHDDRGNRQMNRVDVPLLDPVEIQNLVNNEMITLPLAKRLDGNYHKIKSVPIFASGPYHFPNARDLLKHKFSLDYYTSDLRIDSATIQFDYKKDLFIDFTPYYLRLEQEVQSDEFGPNFKIKNKVEDVLTALNGAISDNYEEEDQIESMDDQVTDFKRNSSYTLINSEFSQDVQLAHEALIEAAKLASIPTDNSSWGSVFNGGYMLNNPTIKDINNDLMLTWKAIWGVDQVLRGEIELSQLGSILADGEYVDDDPDDY
ncbi:type IV secretory system conjugative DNA transfer family protein [Weissella kandleri]|nr:type IV secretory system conjugative DNA transfer family protein [Weissella kandleri]